MDHKIDSKIEKNTGYPMYLQVADRIVASILSGQLTADQKIMSIREASREMGVNHKTVEMAIQILTDEQILEKRARSGIYVKDVSAIAIGRFVNKYHAQTAETEPIRQQDDPCLSLVGNHGVCVWIEWDSLGPRYVDSIREELRKRNISADVMLNAAGHPAIRLDQGYLSPDDFALLIQALHLLLVH